MEIQNFGALIKVNELFDFVVKDLQVLKDAFACARLAEQQIASADSIAANIEEGFGRGSRKEYIQYLIIARGSAQETRGRYGRLKHWLPPETIESRQLLCNEIIAILSATIQTLRAKT